MSGQPQVSPGEPVRLQRDGARATIVVDRPERRNALDGTCYERLSQLLDDLRSDSSVRVVVVTGAGGHFCAGQDLADSMNGEHPLTWLDRASQVVLRLHDLSVPTIAQVDGAAIGAGWSLALACDLVVASDRASFCQAFTRRGISPDLGGSWLLPRIAGPLQARRLALLAETIDAGEALRLGLVTFVEPAASLSDRVDRLAAQLAAGPPIALRQTKQLLAASHASSLAEALAAETRAQAVNLGTTDSQAAFRAFLARQEPSFDGRWILAEDNFEPTTSRSDHR